MTRNQLAFYWLARRMAQDQDRAGIEPGPFLRVLTGLISLAILGAVAIPLLAVVLMILWKLGITS